MPPPNRNCASNQCKSAVKARPANKVYEVVAVGAQLVEYLKLVKCLALLRASKQLHTNGLVTNKGEDAPLWLDELSRKAEWYRQGNEIGKRHPNVQQGMARPLVLRGMSTR